MPFEVRIDIPNEAAWKAAMADAARGTQFMEANEKFLNAAGAMLAEKIRAKTPRAFGTLRGAIGYKVTDRENLIVGVVNDATGPSSRLPASQYAQFVEEGRAPGAMPPPNVLRPWMQKVGYTGSAYQLARSIARKGTRPKPFLVPTLYENEGQILSMATAAYNQALEKIAGKTQGGLFGRILGGIASFFGFGA